MGTGPASCPDSISHSKWSHDPFSFLIFASKKEPPSAFFRRSQTSAVKVTRHSHHSAAVYHKPFLFRYSLEYLCTVNSNVVFWSQNMSLMFMYKNILGRIQVRICIKKCCYMSSTRWQVEFRDSSPPKLLVSFPSHHALFCGELPPGVSHLPTSFLPPCQGKTVSHSHNALQLLSVKKHCSVAVSIWHTKKSKMRLYYEMLHVNAGRQ